MGKSLLGDKKREKEWRCIFYCSFFSFRRHSEGQALVNLKLEVGSPINSIPSFNGEAKSILDDSGLIDMVVKSLQDAEKKILEMNAQLQLLETEEIKFEDNYFQSFNEAKSYLRQTRQERQRQRQRQ